MAKTVRIELGGQTYDVPQLNIGQLERVTDMLTGAGSATAKAGFGVLRIAMERATPKVELDELAGTTEEIAAAVTAILDLSGLKKKETPAGEGAPA